MATFKIKDKQTGEIFTIREKAPGVSPVAQPAGDVPVGQLTPEQLSAEGIQIMTPEQRMAQEFRTDIPQILSPQFKETIAPIIGGISTAAFGLPEAIGRRVAPQGAEILFGEQQTGPGRALRGISETVGLLGGGAARAATRSMNLIPKTIKGSNIIKGLIGGGTFGLLQLDKDPTFKKQLDQAGKGAAIGGLFGLGTKALSKFSSKEPQVAA